MLSLKQARRSCVMAINATTTVLLISAVLNKTQAQAIPADTLSLNLKQAEKMFLEKNLDLLAQHYNIEAGKAMIQQAKLWDDPTLATDQNVYARNKWFEHGTNPDGTPSGQYFIQAQQLIKTAGKRGKQISMATTNANMNEWQFNETMQNLKFQLRSDFFTASQLRATQQLYQRQKEQLDTLLAGMNGQFKSGNIARKDLLRVQALQITLQQEMTDNIKQSEDIQAELKTLLQITGETYIRPVDMPFVPHPVSLTLASLIDTARAGNASYKLEQLQLQYQNQNLNYQKALAVPDITVSPSYDLNSNYAPHYVGLGISLPIPILNGNRGNIKAARWQVKQQETNLSQADVRLKNDVTAAYKKYQYTLQLNTAAQQDFYSDYSKLQENIAQSFRLRQISLLEFIDYFNDYEAIRTKQLQQQLDLYMAAEELNLQVGADVVE